METYLVNGVELTYDTFDLEQIERWEQESKRVNAEFDRIRQQESGAAAIRSICYAMMDSFDILCGEGTAHRVFGDRVNVKEIYEGYQSFFQAVSRAIQEFSKQPTESMNRESRRRAAYRA